MGYVLSALIVVAAAYAVIFVSNMITTAWVS
jgi:hypothetical protein